MKPGSFIFWPVSIDHNSLEPFETCTCKPLSKGLSNNVSIILMFLAYLVLTVSCSSLAQPKTPQEKCLSSLPNKSAFCMIIEGTAHTCKNQITIPSGLIPFSDQNLFSKAFEDPGHGGLCCGVILSVTEPITVFRAWTNPKNKYGNWWSPTPPPMSKDEYRWQDDICYEWDHNLAFVSTCELKRHALVAIGPGQSACCSDGNFYPESNIIQYYIPGKSEVVKNAVENCQECRWSDCPWR